MTKEELRVKIIEILENNIYYYTSPRNKVSDRGIPSKEIPFIADDILGGFADVSGTFEPTDEDNGLLRRAYNHLTPHRFDKNNKFMVDLNNLIERIKQAKN